MVMKQSLVPVCAGMVAGVMASVALGRVMGSLLFGISAWDPATISGVVSLLISVGAAAALPPVRRATRVDPASALRYE